PHFVPRTKLGTEMGLMCVAPETGFARVVVRRRVVLRLLRMLSLVPVCAERGKRIRVAAEVAGHVGVSDRLERFRDVLDYVRIATLQRTSIHVFVCAL